MTAGPVDSLLGAFGRYNIAPPGSDEAITSESQWRQLALALLIQHREDGFGFDWPAYDRMAEVRTVRDQLFASQRRYYSDAARRRVLRRAWTRAAFAALPLLKRQRGRPNADTTKGIDHLASRLHDSVMRLTLQIAGEIAWRIEVPVTLEHVSGAVAKRIAGEIVRRGTSITSLDGRAKYRLAREAMRDLTTRLAPFAVRQSGEAAAAATVEKIGAMVERGHLPAGSNSIDASSILTDTYRRDAEPRLSPKIQALLDFGRYFRQCECAAKRLENLPSQPFHVDLARWELSGISD